MTLALGLRPRNSGMDCQWNARSKQSMCIAAQMAAVFGRAISSCVTVWAVSRLIY